MVGHIDSPRAGRLVPAGIPQHVHPPIDGVDLMPYLTGQDQGLPHRELFWRLNQKTAIRVGDWKLLRNPDRRGQQDAPWKLYNLANDLSESNDLSTDEPERVRQLSAAWTRLNDEMMDPIWSPVR